MKIEICDLCYKEKNQLKQSIKYTRARVKDMVLKLHYCEECDKTAPKKLNEFIKLFYRINYSKDEVLSDEEVNEFIRTGLLPIITGRKAVKKEV